MGSPSPSETATHARVGLTQSGMSNALAQLRRVFDDPLFVRARGGVEPTLRALADALSRGDGRPLYLIVGMIAAKDAAGFIKPLAGLSPKGLWALPVPGTHASSPPERITAIARRAGLTAYETKSVEDALAAIRGRAPGRVLITGSLYLAGAVLEKME